MTSYYDNNIDKPYRDCFPEIARKIAGGGLIPWQAIFLSDEPLTAEDIRRGQALAALEGE